MGDQGSEKEGHAGVSRRALAEASLEGRQLRRKIQMSREGVGGAGAGGRPVR